MRVRELDRMEIWAIRREIPELDAEGLRASDALREARGKSYQAYATVGVPEHDAVEPIHVPPSASKKPLAGFTVSTLATIESTRSVVSDSTVRPNSRRPSPRP